MKVKKNYEKKFTIQYLRFTVFTLQLAVELYEEPTSLTRNFHIKQTKYDHVDHTTHHVDVDVARCYRLFRHFPKCPYPVPYGFGHG